MNICKNKNKGFTVIELIVVIAIIAVLSSIIVFNITLYLPNSRDERRKMDIANIQMALELYYSEHGNYPISGGANFPNGNWTNSSDNHNYPNCWDVLASELNQYLPKLPKDPINQLGYAWYTAGIPKSGKYTYMYYSSDSCERQWYMLVYRPENPDHLTGSWIKDCFGTIYGPTYTGAVTVGVCKNCE